MAVLPRLLLGSLMLAVVGAWLMTHGGSAAGRVRPQARPASLASEIRYGRDIRPILSDRCFQCHGPDRAKQQAGLRLDSFEAATAARPDGAAIVPGSPERSVLLARIHETDPDVVMPPPDSGKCALSDEERRALEQTLAEARRAQTPPGDRPR